MRAVDGLRERECDIGAAPTGERHDAIGDRDWLGGEHTYDRLRDARDAARPTPRLVANFAATRRRIEHDLREGAQLRLMEAGYELRAMKEELPGERGQALAAVERVEDRLSEALDELRAISARVYPAIVTVVGLTQALKALARRSRVPVDLDVEGIGRFPEPVEVAVYEVVSEVLKDADTHAKASFVRVHLDVLAGSLCVVVSHDGIGGPEPNRAPGVAPLIDQAEALGGVTTVTSPPGFGTSLALQLPIDAARDPAR